MASSGEIINDDELALRKAEEAALRRSQASEWLRQMDRGASKGLPEYPSEEEFCLALRNGLILCNVLNKVNPGAVPKVVENPVLTFESTDAAAQSAIQYFENMRNFLVAVSEMKLLTFEASDLEKGGSSGKVVDCILCLKGYYEWRLAGGIGIWRYGGIVKISSSNKGWTSPLPSGEDADGSCNNPTSVHEQQVLEVLNTLSEACLKELKAPNVLSSLFDQFGLQLLQSFLMTWTGMGDLPANPMLVNMVLEQALKELYMQLVSQKNQLASLLKKKMKDGNMSTSKPEFVEQLLGYLKEYSCGSSSCLKLYLCDCSPNVNGEGRLELQQKQLEKLRLSFHEMKAQVERDRRKWEEDLKKFEKHVNNLELTSSSYQKLLEENRSLYNQVQDLKGNIRVYCRVRPFLDNQSDGKSTVDHVGENGNIMIMNPHKQGKDARKIFSFNKVFGANTTQREVFVDTQPLIRSVMDGYNVCIFAYGQTGSGKTYTMSGPDITTDETWGVNYRALRDLFDISKSRTSVMTYDVSVQMIEIYNEQVKDLLVSDGSNRRYPFHKIRNNSQLNGLNIPDASLVSVNCTQDVLDLMKIGHGNRAVGATALNERSSRSHSVLTVHVQGKELISGSISRGCLHLVDLAGSERVDKSEATGERLKEAQHINRSLSALGDVISALAQKNSHIPYRNSKLTQVLQDALGGHAKTLMFVHINPELNSFGETISTLKFAERVASIELGAARANKESGDVRDLKEEISKLKSALEAKESEVAQMKEHTSRITSEMKTSRIVSPLNSQKYASSLNTRPEVGQRAAVETGNFELSYSRSCSSGKQRKSRFPSVSDNEHTSMSPFSSGENHAKSRKLRSPSPVRRSLSTNRATVIKTRPKMRNAEDGPILKLQFPEKASTNTFTANVPTVFSNGHSRGVFSEREEEQFKPIAAARKPKAGSKSDLSEIENDGSLVDSPLSSRLRELRLHHHVTRMSQNIEPRNFMPTVEPLWSGKHENKPPTGLVRNPKEGSKAIPEIRRSRSLPRGKVVLP
ncbi:kinesin-like protein KIN-14F isoform X2 [Iris pallida]|uniref:Kinesin-like protein KIN-14F isoform X2 n=1 Tax=Iris pallida TaxID=29817 RepID=A0AAX6E9A1_IRIPA|nr:kinesin-like protein KIN-14F isoform X2 [Iris pallida]